MVDDPVQNDEVTFLPLEGTAADKLAHSQTEQMGQAVVEH